MQAEVYIARTDAENNKTWVRYDVPYSPSDRVAQVLQYIHEHIDGSISYRRCFCKRGSCGLCMMNVNGKNVKTCIAPAEPVMYIDSLPLKVIRDLVIEFS